MLHMGGPPHMWGKEGSIVPACKYVDQSKFQAMQAMKPI